MTTTINPFGANTILGYKDNDRNSLWFVPVANATAAGDIMSLNSDRRVALHSAATAASTPTSVIFIDARVPDLQTLINGAAPGAQVWVLNADLDGIQQIADVLKLSGSQDLDSIQIISHGSEGAVQLGSSVLDAGNLAAYAEQLADIGASLTADGDLLLFGCDVAGGDAGLHFIANLAAATGADVAASTNLTGNSDLGGDWVLEASTGTIEAAASIAPTALVSFDGVLANETFTVTQTTVLTVDVDADGVADPGDTVTTTVVITNNSTNTDATNVQFAETLVGMTLVNQPGNDINVSPLALNDTYTAIGNTLLEVGNATTQTGPQSSVAGRVTDNDVEFLGDTFTISAFQSTSANGGTVNMITSGADAGSFTYISAANFTGADTFTYTIRDKGLDGVAGNADDLTGVGTVTINVSNQVWYVDNSFVGVSDGRSTNPFTSLASVTGATGPDTAGDIIYVHSGAGSYTGGITLLDNQTLHGANTALVVGGFTLAAAGTDPTITNAAGNGVTLASGNTLTGFTVGDSSGFDIANTNTATVGNLTISNVNLNGTGGLFRADAGGTLNVTLDSASTTSAAGNGIHLAGTTSGTFTVNGSGTLSGVAGTDVLIGGSSSAAVNIASNISSNAGGSIEVTGHTGASGITFSGDLNITGGTGISVHDNSGSATINFTNANANAQTINTGANAAVSLVNNTGLTINFTGGNLDIDTTTGAGFTATGGGTVTVQGTGNTINSVSATALNVVNTNIGAADLTFQSISAGNNTAAADPASGIILNNTGAAGGLNVTGTGVSTSATAGTVAASLGSGGTIQFTTGDAILISGVAGGVSLKSMIIGNNAADAVTAGTAVNIGEEGITILNSDNVALENVKIGDSGRHGIDGQNVTNLSLINVSIINSGDTDFEDAINFNGESTNQVDGTFLIKNSVIATGYENNVNISNTSGNLDLTIAGSTFGANHNPNGNDSVLVETLGTGQMDVVVTGSTFTSGAGDLFQFTTNGTGGGVRDTLWFKDNTLSNNHGTIATGGGGVSIFSASSGGFAFNIENNTFRDAVGGAVLIVKAANNSALVEGYFQNNTIGVSGAGTDNLGSREGSALKVQTLGGGTLNIAIEDNQILDYNNFGIELLAGGGASATGGNFFASVTGNTVAEPGNTAGVQSFPKNALHLNAGTNAGDTFLISLNATGNNFTAGGLDAVPATVGDIDIRLRERQSTTVELPGYTGANNDNTAVGTFVDNNNAGANNDTELVSNTVGAGGGGYINSPGGVARALPSVLPTPPAPLLAAEVADAGLSFTSNDSAGTPATLPEVNGDADAPVATGGEVIFVDDGLLSQSELNTIAAAAMQRWSAAGLSAEQLTLLQNVNITVSDLPDLYLGSFVPGHITLDVNGAGQGWFIDTSPLDDVEFANAHSATRFTADATAPAAGRYDLLTTVMHELGHQLGVADSYGEADRDALNYGLLFTGERRVPGTGAAQGAVAGSIASEEFLGAPVTIGTLPFGKSVTIQFQATINPQTNQVIVNPVNSGTVSASNAVGFPDTNTNVVTTTLDTLTLGNLIFNDVNRNGVFDASDAGVNGVALTLFADNGTTPGAFDAGDTQIATTTTAGGGLYTFTGLAPGDYILRVNVGNFTAGQPLAALQASATGQPDPDNNTDNDDNGAGTPGQAHFSLPITLAYNTEITPGTGNDTNNTLDIGFVNATPVTTASGGTTAFTEGNNVPSTPIAVDNALVVTDIDSANLTGATVSITGGFQVGEDVLAFTNQNGISGSYSAGTGVLTLAGSASIANYQTALRSVTYTDTSDTPNTANRTVSFTVNDGTSNSTASTKTVSVTAVNDTPTATNLSAAETYTEDTPLNLINIVAADVDSANVTATLTLSNTAAGALSTATSGAVTSTFAAGVWTASGAVADVNTLLAGVTFNPALDFNGNFSVATSVSDGTSSVTGSKAFTGVAVNDAPVATASGGTTGFAEGNNVPSTPVVIDSALTVTDVDSANLVSATVAISGGLQTGEDLLAFTNQNGIIGSYAAGTGILTLNGIATVANYQTALRSVTYTNTSDTPNTANRTISFTVNDGSNSIATNKTVSVAAVDDTPTATNLNAAETYTEDTPLNLTDIVAADVDSANVTATLTLSNAAAGALSTATSGAVTSTFAAGVWTASGAVADVNTLLAGVSFNPAANFNGNFSIATSVSDGTSGAAGSKAFTGVAVNDAPAGTDKTVTMPKNTDYIFTVADFGFSDIDDSPANSLLAVQITALPAQGALNNNGAPVVAGQFITLADIAGSLLKFTPVTDAIGNGYASVAFKVQDNGGTANGGIDLDPTANAVTIDVTNGGSSNGDPHIWTFDGFYYDFQAQGDFVLVRGLDSGLEIQVRHGPYDPIPGATVITALATVVDGNVVIFDVGQAPPLVNGTPMALALGETRALGQGTVSRTNSPDGSGDFYRVTYANGDHLTVDNNALLNIDTSVYLIGTEHVVGLLGNNNGLAADDLALRDGTITDNPLATEYLYGVFTDNWTVKPEESLFEQPEALAVMLMGSANNEIHADFIH